MTAAQRDRQIKRLEVLLTDADGDRFYALSCELSELIAAQQAEQGGIHHETPLDLQEPTEHPNDAFRQAMQAAITERRRLADKPSTMPVSETGGTQLTQIVNV
jgi:hypothetical protein